MPLPELGNRNVVQLEDSKNIPPSGPWPRLLLIPAGCFSQPGSVEHTDSWESKASPRQLVRLACFQGRIWNSYRICAIGIEGFRLTQAPSDRHKLMLSAASYLPLHKTGGAPTASGRMKPTVSGYLFGSEHRTAFANTFEYFGCRARISYPLPSRAYGFLGLATMLPQTN